MRISGGIPFKSFGHMNQLIKELKKEFKGHKLLFTKENDVLLYESYVKSPKIFF